MGVVVFPSGYLIWDQTIVELMKIMATSFIKSSACSAALRDPNPTASHLQPLPLPKTPGHSQATLHQSLLGAMFLSPGSWCAQGFVCALQESVSPVLCKFSWLYGKINGDLHQEGILPHPGLVHPEPLSLKQATVNPYPHRDTQTLKDRSVLSLCGVSWCAKVLFEPSKCLWQVCGSKIIIPCWTTINRTKLDPTKKWYPLCKGKGEATAWW